MSSSYWSCELARSSVADFNLSIEQSLCPSATSRDQFLALVGVALEVTFYRNDLLRYFCEESQYSSAYPANSVIAPAASQFPFEPFSDPSNSSIISTPCHSMQWLCLWHHSTSSSSFSSIHWQFPWLWVQPCTSHGQDLVFLFVALQPFSLGSLYPSPDALFCPGIGLWSQNFSP